jgi:hypothetical protein
METAGRPPYGKRRTGTRGYTDVAEAGLGWQWAQWIHSFFVHNRSYTFIVGLWGSWRTVGQEDANAPTWGLATSHPLTGEPASRAHARAEHPCLGTQGIPLHCLSCAGGDVGAQRGRAAHRWGWGSGPRRPPSPPLGAPCVCIGSGTCDALSS